MPVDLTSELAFVRRERLKQLIKDLNGYENAAHLLGSSRGKLSRLTNPGQKHSRAITDSEARSFEQIAGKPVGWMDNRSGEGQEQVAEVSSDHIHLTIEEDIPPRAHGLRMKDYGERLFLETWSHRLRINAIRYRGLNSIINMSVWRSGWLSVMAKGQLTSEDASNVVKHLSAMKEAIHGFSADSGLDDILVFPSDTVRVGDIKPQDATYLIDPQPAPASSIHAWINQRQFQKSERFGDLAAVFQVSLWGDGTLRGAFSGFPLRQDAADVEVKLGQLCEIILANVEVHRLRQASS